MSTSSSSSPPAEERPSLAARAEAVVLRAIFVGLVVLTAVVLGRDLTEQLDRAPLFEPDAPWPQAEPYLPSARPDGDDPGRRSGSTPEERLRAPMTLELLAGGRLTAVGTITPGTAGRLAEELARRGDYVETVALDSPGGSVQDALAMGRLIRERRLGTAVEPGALCASSCPLVLAGGVERRAAADAAVGVHQITTVKTAGFALPGAEPEMVRAQRVSAEVQRHLVEMGVDAEVWFHAMETPPREMYYFTAEELATLRLAKPSTE
jgi:hypothetical protein